MAELRIIRPDSAVRSLSHCPQYVFASCCSASRAGCREPEAQRPPAGGSRLWRRPVHFQPFSKQCRTGAQEYGAEIEETDIGPEIALVASRLCPWALGRLTVRLGSTGSRWTSPSQEFCRTSALGAGTERQMGGTVLGRRNGDGMKPTKAHAVLGDRVCMTIPGVLGSKELRQLRRPVSVRVELSGARHPSKRSQIGTPGTRPVRANGT